MTRDEGLTNSPEPVLNQILEAQVEEQLETHLMNT